LVVLVVVLAIPLVVLVVLLVIPLVVSLFCLPFSGPLFVPTLLGP
jgi:hypothetical protein